MSSTARTAGGPAARPGIRRPASRTLVRSHSTARSALASSTRASSPAGSSAVAGTKRKEPHPSHDAGNTGEETNIRVVVRCRGRNQRETDEDIPVVVKTDEINATVDLPTALSSTNRKTYAFDRVFSSAIDQASVFDDTVKPMLDEMLKGYNCTCFAYGQTGTGKTHTMSGDVVDRMGFTSPDAGIIPRMFTLLFTYLSRIPNSQHAIKCSFIELYNEELRDLLSEDDSTKLKIFEHGDFGTVVQGTDERYIHSAADGIKLLLKGNSKRQVAATKCNDRSSRSHTVFTITAYLKPENNDSSKDVITLGKLNLVDLAGSENIKNSGASDKRAAEAGKINKSLLTLGQVINALVDHSQHIPYRQSNLTRLLQDSLGGRTKTCIIATISPVQTSLQETLSTLDYASRAKSIKNQPQLNTPLDAKLVLSQIAREAADMRKELAAARSKDGVWMASDAYEEMKTRNESRAIVLEEQKARIKVLEANKRSVDQELYKLGDSYTAMESKFEEEVTALQSSLQVMIHDVDQLHDSNGRKSELQSVNQALWDATQSLVEEATVQLLDAYREFDGDHDEMLSALLSAVDKYKKESLQQVGKCEAAFEEQQQVLDGATQDLDDQVAGAWDSLRDALLGMQKVQDSGRTRTADALDRSTKAVQTSSTEIQSAAEAWGSRMADSILSCRKELLEVCETVVQDTVSLLAEHEDLRRQHDNALAQIIHSQEAMAEEQRKVQEERKRRRDERHEAQMAFLRAQMEAEKERYEADVAFDNEASSGIQGKLLEMDASLKAAQSQRDEDMDAWRDKAAKIQERLQDISGGLATKTNDLQAIALDGAHSIQETVTSNHKQMEDSVTDFAGKMTSDLAALDDLLRQSQRGTAETRERQSQLVEHVSSVAQKQSSAAVDLFKAEQTRVDAFDSSMVSDLKMLRDAAEAQFAAVSKQLTELQENIRQKVMEEYEPTGETPKKRVLTVAESAFNTKTSGPDDEQPVDVAVVANDTVLGVDASPKPEATATLVFADPEPKIPTGNVRLSMQPPSSPSFISADSSKHHHHGVITSLREVSSNRTFNPLALSTMSMPPPSSGVTSFTAGGGGGGGGGGQEKPSAVVLSKHKRTGKPVVRSVSGLKRPAGKFSANVASDVENLVPLGEVFEQGGSRRKSPRLN